MNNSEIQQTGIPDPAEITPSVDDIDRRFEIHQRKRVTESTVALGGIIHEIALREMTLSKENEPPTRELIETARRLTQSLGIEKSVRIVSGTTAEEKAINSIHANLTRATRVLSGLSQDELAERAGTNRYTVIRVERGKQRPSQLFANACHAVLEEFRSEQFDVNDAVLARAARYLTGLSQEEFAKMHNVSTGWISHIETCRAPANIQLQQAFRSQIEDATSESRRHINELKPGKSRKND